MYCMAIYHGINKRIYGSRQRNGGRCLSTWRQTKEYNLCLVIPTHKKLNIWITIFFLYLLDSLWIWVSSFGKTWNHISRTLFYAIFTSHLMKFYHFIISFFPNFKLIKLCLTLLNLWERDPVKKNGQCWFFS